MKYGPVKFAVSNLIRCFYANKKPLLSPSPKHMIFDVFMCDENNISNFKNYWNMMDSGCQDFKKRKYNLNKPLNKLLSIGQDDLDYPERQRSPLLQVGDRNAPDPIEAKREEIKKYFNETFNLYENLFKTMACDAAYYQRADPLRHPLIFYYGHTAVFFVNKFSLMKLIPDRINPQFESIMAVGVDEMSWDDLDDTHYNWPSIQAVTEYRRQVRELVNDLIDKTDVELPIKWTDPMWIVLMAIEHERIHLETSSVLIRQLPLNMVTPHEIWRPCTYTGMAPINRLLTVKGGTVTLGDNRNIPAVYGWDCEYGSKIVEVESFSASQYLVTNEEFLEFIDDGGYKNQNFWDEEGWQWLKYQNTSHPRFWVERPDGLKLRLMTHEIEMPWDWPVECNYLEGKAFCNWLTEKTGKSIRLPTESEWVLLRNQEMGETNYPNWGPFAPACIDLCFEASSCPVTFHKHGRFFDLIGNVWQWTETYLNGLPGFEPHNAYDDFTTPTFDGKHNVIKGGSWISTGHESKYSCRFGFRRHFYQHAGFRYVESEVTPKQDVLFYETDVILSQYLDCHFGPAFLPVEKHCKKLVEISIKHLEDGNRQFALDLGCAVGGVSFELCKYFDRVDGVDLSTRFIRSAISLQEQGRLKYTIVEEGELVSYRECDLAQLGITDNQAKKINFYQADACNLNPRLFELDLIIASNMLDRLYDPLQFLSNIHKHLKSGGILILATVNTWTIKHTPKEKWLGGVKKDAESFSTFDAICEILGMRFELIDGPMDIDFTIRETRRKCAYMKSETTVWRKKS